MNSTASDDRVELLRELYRAACDAVAPRVCLPPVLPAPSAGRTVVIGAGKAAAEMARVLESHWPSEALSRLTGLVVTRYQHGVQCRRIKVLEAAHPVPDAAGRQAASQMLAAVRDLQATDQVICLLSGGGSALMVEPLSGISLDDKQQVNRDLLRSGANITEMNCVRKHLSAIKGGRLGLACGAASLTTLIISDIPGDDPAVTASGPSLPDTTTCADAIAVLARYQIEVPPSVRALLESGRAETPKPEAFIGKPHTTRVIARAEDALLAAARLAESKGIVPIILSDRLEGEARALARTLGQLARRSLEGGHYAAFRAPVVILSGGETTVTVRGNGRGGRNAEFLLALALELEGAHAYGLAADTDGIDGSEDNAGCVFDPTTLPQLRAAGGDPEAMLANNDAYSAFAMTDGLIMTGPTRTNVNDFRALLLEPR